MYICLYNLFIAYKVFKIPKRSKQDSFLFVFFVSQPEGYGLYAATTDRGKSIQIASKNESKINPPRTPANTWNAFASDQCKRTV